MTEDLDQFVGYLPEDVDRIKALLPTDIIAHPGVFTDIFGIKVDPSYCPWAYPGGLETDLPFPRDRYLADGIEFAAVALALEMAAGRKQLTAVEVGAGWGPWTALMGTLAKRAGYQRINLSAFEADAVRFESMREHLALNGILPGPFNLDLRHRAAWWRSETLYWPVGGSGTDAGMAVVSGPRPNVDYRGKALVFQKIKADPIASVPYSRIDFLHVDIQGREWDLISNSAAFLSTKVRCMFVGTHSRKIEGDLIEFLRAHKWTLMRERPCRFWSMAEAPSLAGLTYHDGGQFWRNDQID